MTLKSKRGKKATGVPYPLPDKSSFFINSCAGSEMQPFFSRLLFSSLPHPPFRLPHRAQLASLHPSHYLDVFSEYRPPLGKATTRASWPFARLVRCSARRIHGPRTDAPEAWLRIVIERVPLRRSGSRCSSRVSAGSSASLHIFVVAHMCGGH